MGRWFCLTALLLLSVEGWLRGRMLQAGSDVLITSQIVLRYSKYDHKQRQNVTGASPPCFR